MSAMKYFAPKAVGAHERLERATTPVGKPCNWCREPIETNDRGFLVWDEHAGYRPLHEECSVRQIVGPVSHLQRRCACFGGAAAHDDDQGLTRREAARAAHEYWRKHPSQR